MLCSLQSLSNSFLVCSSVTKCLFLRHTLMRQDKQQVWFQTQPPTHKHLNHWNCYKLLTRFRIPKSATKLNQWVQMQFCKTVPPISFSVAQSNTISDLAISNPLFIWNKEGYDLVIMKNWPPLDLTKNCHSTITLQGDVFSEGKLALMP